MAEFAQMETAPPPAFPVVRTIAFADVRAALAEGWGDFARAPMMGLCLGGIFALGGLMVVGSVVLFGMSYLAYPLAAGFVLLGPFAAAGLYEISRRIELGVPLSWGGVLRVMFAQSGREFAWMAFVSIFAFIVWMYQVRLLLALFLGFRSFASLGEFLHVLASTQDGLTFLAVGHVVGAAMALIVFSLTAVSFPLLLDRDVDFITAMIVSVSGVTKNPGPMLAWGAIVVAALILAAAPAFLGLFVALPVLGHATWRLYRRLVEPAGAVSDAVPT
ncbi:MAG: hypothetical protein JWN93_869 [Hyphomicrobiales bacterium]|jgi:uncharacterized membrane protein|nr:hypothetical protein [Hyphomicrobiales bacterium]